jgi:hypothetical protein
MPTDAERWRFLADHTVTLHTEGGEHGHALVTRNGKITKDSWP